MALLVAALGGMLLTGCKSSGTQAAGSPSPSSSGSPSGSVAPSPSGSRSAAPSPTPSTGAPRPSQPAPTKSAPASGTVRTFTGTVTRGVEPGCTILRSSGGTYELVGADAAAKKVLQPQASVEVRGYLEHGLMSHCMQGPMLKVVSAKAR
ncbi:hypothetical protein [Actinocatenispora sera]|uniref:hypothetical protein n=1 Tax=Actinocatenispora sera TaxID=390989 RepID=UPI00068A41E4|nr:hypothetical protein [Actinocatenispora sera]